MSQSVSLSTVQNWEKDVDSLREWLPYDQSGGKVTRIFCELCHKHKDRLRAIRNFNSAFVDGVTGRDETITPITRYSLVIGVIDNR